MSFFPLNLGEGHIQNPLNFFRSFRLKTKMNSEIKRTGEVI